MVARFFKDKRLGRPMDDATSMTHIDPVEFDGDGDMDDLNFN